MAPRLSGTETRIDASGLRELRRDLRRIDKNLAKAFNRALREIGNEIRDEIRGSTQRPYRTGKLRRSVKTSVRAKGVSLYSLLKYAPVHEWGGTIRPRGTPITIERTEFIRGQVIKNREETERKVGDLIERTFEIYGGFH